MRARRRSAVRSCALALAAIAPLLASGCGGGSSSNGTAAKSPDEIVAATKAAADAASSVHLAGSIVTGGTPIALNMHLLAGKGGRGQLSENGLGFELVQIGNTVYIKGSPAFYRHIGGSAAAQLLQGKWLKAPTSSADFASITSLTDLHRLIDTTLASHGVLRKGPKQTVAGHEVVGLTDASKGGTLYVSTTGKPYPVAITKPAPGGGTIVFDHWNESVPLSAPANAIDLTQLQKLG